VQEPVAAEVVADAEATVEEAADLEAANDDSGSNGHEDESIESYMDRLLKRVRGDSPTAPGAWRQILQPSAPAPALAPAAPVAAPATTLQPTAASTPTKAAADEDYVPRTVAPERVTVNFGAMREVANSAARSAIDQHVRKHSGKIAVGKLVGASLTIAASILLGYWAWRTDQLTAKVGAGIGAGVGLQWLMQGMRRVLNLMRLDRQQIEPRPSAPEVNPSPPQA
jgi:hypothetical protein